MKRYINHYKMIQRLQKAGGLRKELTPESCVIMLLVYEGINVFDACIIASDIHNQIKGE